MKVKLAVALALALVATAAVSLVPFQRGDSDRTIEGMEPPPFEMFPFDTQLGFRRHADPAIVNDGG